MAIKIVLAWQVDAAGSIFSVSQAATALEDVALYLSTETDPILGQLFGMTVDSDTTTTAGTVATRTLTLNMTLGTPPAPPAFPCRPITSTLPIPPYPLRTAVSLAGSFFVTLASQTVKTSASQLSALNVGDQVQFLSRPGVFYQVASVGSTTIGLNTPYAGQTINTGAFKEAVAPATIVAAYSTSDLDTNGVATVPAIPPGPGAQVLVLSYKDSTGAGPFSVSIDLAGKYPVPVTLAVGSKDVAEIESFTVFSPDGFGASIGQITLVELAAAPPAIPSNATPAEFAALTDVGQMAIKRSLVYMPPSYYALSQQDVTSGLPSNAALSALVGEYVAIETAGPPANPPLDPVTVPTPTFLSGLFTKTLQLALAVPVVAQPIAIA